MAKGDHTKAAERESGYHLFHAAFDKTAKHRAALTAGELMTINIDVPMTVARVFGAVPRLMTFRDRVEKALPEADLRQLDMLLTFAQALSHAQAMYRMASEPADGLPAAQAKAMSTRDVLATDARALAKRGMIDGKRLEKLLGGPGYLNTSEDLALLVGIFREGWHAIQGKTAVTLKDLDDGEMLYQQIQLGYGARLQHSDKIAAASEERQRAFTVLLNAYDEAQRAISYLRWKEDDLEEIAPSLWEGRGRRTRASGAPTPTASPPGATPAPSAIVADPAQSPIAPPVAPMTGSPNGNSFTH